jgi:hypothetical protein
MASFGQFYTPPQGTPLGFTLGEIAAKKGDLNVNQGLNRFELGRQTDRAIDDTHAKFATQGSFYGSARRKATNKIYEDSTWAGGRSEIGFSQAINDLDRQRRLATFGVLY